MFRNVKIVLGRILSNFEFFHSKSYVLDLSETIDISIENEEKKLFFLGQRQKTCFCRGGGGGINFFRASLI